MNYANELSCAVLTHYNVVARDLPGGKRIRIMNMRAQHITFNKVSSPGGQISRSWLFYFHFFAFGFFSAFSKFTRFLRKFIDYFEKGIDF
jgi:hypothetical protein